jgi:hypothetical protein
MTPFAASGLTTHGTDKVPLPRRLMTAPLFAGVIRIAQLSVFGLKIPPTTVTLPVNHISVF